MFFTEVTMNSIVYIDGQNFLYKVSDVLKNAGIISDKQEVTAVDILTPEMATEAFAQAQSF
ncbi:hypothetical protein IJ798_01615 [Candidatus Saccharibacteria bacterium]|nr:hypothetical protein [Candidatus Saccharibacteria bacterium]